MVKDIDSGSSGSSVFSLAAVGNTLYFRATDGANGYELWKSDGTASGTVMVKDINSGSSSSIPQYLTIIGDTLYFSALSPGNGYELWKSDGTASGTVMDQDIHSTGGSSPADLILVGNTLYFTAMDGIHGRELWALDPDNITGLNSGSGGGSGGGMTNVTGATCTVSPSLPTGLSIDSSTCTISGTPTAETSNTTYTVTANINSVTYQTTVWLSTSPYGTITSAVDGAALNLGEAMTPITLNYTSQAPAGSFYSGNGSYWMTKDINPTTGSFSFSQKTGISGNPYGLASLGDFAYFTGRPTSSTDGLWKSDGTESGTVPVKEHLHASYMVSDGNSLYFHNGTQQFWMSDGTTPVQCCSRNLLRQTRVVALF